MLHKAAESLGAKRSNEQGGAAGQAPRRVNQRMADYLGRQHLSIRAKILLSFTTVILMLGGISAVLIWQMVE